MARGRLDVVVVGGGVVGTAAALALARLDLDVALVEAAAPAAWDASRPDLRVYAFAPDNAGLLHSLGVWHAVAEARAQPYRHMRVWDAASPGELHFDADAFGRRELGWIVEHGLLVDRLFAALPAAGVRLYCPARVESIEQDASAVRLQLDDGLRLDARIVVAADGPASTLRTLSGIEVDRHDYHQRALVAYVDTAQPHAETAWQRFLPGGPLAFLPCAGPEPDARGHRSSIVWTLPDDEARRLLAVDETVFEKALTTAFDARLGAVTLRSPRAGFALQRQLARDYVRGRVLLLGDAAHVVHPLAGQGVNLGLRDVSALLDSVAAARAAQADWASTTRIARWARSRRSHDAVAAFGFEAINRAFSNDGLAAILLRGRMLGIAGALPPLSQWFWRKASGT